MSQRILIVDDDPGALKFVSYTLDRAGYGTATAQNGFEALARLRAESFDLIILDVMMPGMSGYKVCARLRGELGTADIPIIMLSAKSMVEDKVSGYQSGADEYVSKPILPSELVERVRSLLLESSGSSGGGGGTRTEPRAIGFVGAKGGVGTSTLAINVAFVLAEAGRSVILADFSVVPEATSETLGLAPSHALGTYLRKAKGKTGSSSLAPFLVNLRAGLRVLPPPTELTPGELFQSPERLGHLGAGLASMSEVLILDLGCALNLPTFSLVENLDRVVLVSEPTRIGFHLLAAGWNHLASSGHSQDRCEAVLVRRKNGRTFSSEEGAHQALRIDRQPVFIAAIAEDNQQQTEAYLPPALAHPDSFFAIQVQELAKNLLPPAN